MARKKKKKHSEEEAGEAWLLPYSDLMTLLLAVFIVLFAVSKIDQAKAEKISQAFTQTMMAGAAASDSGAGAAAESTVSAEPTPSADPAQAETSALPEGDGSTGNNVSVFLDKFEYDNLSELKTELDTMLENEQMTYVVTSIDKRGLIISLSNAILFDSGSAEIKENDKGTLMQIAQTINQLDNYIRVEGHTDNVPIKNSDYPSNWELSAARAASVVRLFIDECNVSPDKVVAVGYGEHKPVADNSTEEGRAKNRRIDIIVLSEKYDNLEQHVVP